MRYECGELYSKNKLCFAESCLASSKFPQSTTNILSHCDFNFTKSKLTLQQLSIGLLVLVSLASSVSGRN